MENQLVLAFFGAVISIVLFIVVYIIIPYTIIKTAVYKAIKAHQDSMPRGMDYETIRDAVTAGMLNYDEQNKEMRKKG